MYPWLDDYTAALLEKDPVRLKTRLDELTQAIEQRRLSPVGPDSKELEALERAEKAIKILKEIFD